MNLIREDQYAQDMEQIVLPYLEPGRSSGDFERVPGQKIHYRIYQADEPHADLVLVHGFSEGIDKFNETVYYFLQAGFNVWQIQQRGHGRSYRAVSDPSLVHITDYRDLIEDLRYFVTQIVRRQAQPERPLYLFAHSMGGGVGAVYLQTYPQDFAKAVLSSPMLQLQLGSIPLWAAALYARIRIFLGKGDQYMPGGSSFRPEPDFENSCTNSRPRYDYWFEQTLHRTEYQTCASSVATALQFLKLTKKAADPGCCAKVKADVLLVQAGQDFVVMPGGQETFIRQIGQKGRLIRLENARHEIYREVNADLEVYWKEILDFLQ